MTNFQHVPAFVPAPSTPATTPPPRRADVDPPVDETPRPPSPLRARAAESSARDLISTLWSVVEGGGGVVAASNVNALVDLLDEREQREALAAWRGFEIKQRRYSPSSSRPSTSFGCKRNDDSSFLD
ncbi:hypothetical protein B0H11DRAFT_2277920 [Mycena galericulata]|nr:hypothetical protein B0H11DRAFT_2277920 [Mycena galericulata]